MKEKIKINLKTPISHSFEVEMNVAISNKGKRKREVLTANYPLRTKF